MRFVSGVEVVVIGLLNHYLLTMTTLEIFVNLVFEVMPFVICISFSCRLYFTRRPGPF